MSRTLFWYIMRDLLKIFILALLVFSGILSFGGLLKTFMQYGLNSWQMGNLLMCLMPAMLTYSLPFAALFATAVVYGRLSADNELTACRATGISYITLVVPVFIMGLVLAISSLVSLCYVVPRFTLQCEKVLYHSLAEMVEANIQRSHQVKLAGTGTVIYAESAEVQKAAPGESADEVIILYNPMFCSYKQDEATKLSVPSEFYIGREAEVHIHQGDDRVEWWARLKGGIKLPRQTSDGETGGFQVAQIGPMTLPSPIREEPKFMNIRQLNDLYQDPSRSRNIRFLYDKITCAEQEREFLDRVLMDLRDPRKRQYRFDAGEGQFFVLRMDDDPDRKTVPADSKLRLSSAVDGPGIHLIQQRVQQAKRAMVRFSAEREDRLEVILQDVTWEGADAKPIAEQRLVIPMPVGTDLRTAKTTVIPEMLQQLRAGRPCSFETGEGDVYVLSVEGASRQGADGSNLAVEAESGRGVRLAYQRSYDARELTIVAQSDLPRRLMRLEFEMTDVVIGRAAQRNYLLPLAIQMPGFLEAISTRGVNYYVSDGGHKSRGEDVRQLQRRHQSLEMEIRAEIHGRVSFAISCLILVTAGASLAMMFRTGDYLTAFALMAVGAMVCIAVIATGQHVVENDPSNLKLGLTIMWSGNVIVLGLSAGLLGWLQRH